MVKTGPPYRAEHVGSLLRPAELRKAFRDHGEGRIGAPEFKVIQDRAVRDAVALQEDIGFRAVTDGEFRRASYWSHFVQATDGLGVAEARFDFHDTTGASSHFLAPEICGKVRRAGPISGAEFDFLKEAASALPKITMPSPPTMHFWARPGGLAAAGYDLDGFMADLARVYREEIADLCARGAAYIQIDEVPLAMLCDENVRAQIAARGEDPDALVGRYVGLINAALAGRPENLTVAMHLCRGNFKGLWLSEGSYRYVAEALFNEIEVDAFFLEYDTPRAGDFEPLAAVPEHKSVVLGLVSSKTPALEPADDLKRRIDEAAAFIDPGRLSLSPQCGFASAVSGNPVTLEDQIAKLRLVAEVARDVWG